MLFSHAIGCKYGRPTTRVYDERLSVCTMHHRKNARSFLCGQLWDFQIATLLVPYRHTRDCSRNNHDIDNKTVSILSLRSSFEAVVNTNTAGVEAMARSAAVPDCATSSTSSRQGQQHMTINRSCSFCHRRKRRCDGAGKYRCRWACHAGYFTHRVLICLLSIAVQIAGSSCSFL